jgi:predicted homoserine dehydrogenase-like protein
MAVYDKLKAREEQGTPIRVGSTGAGWMGSGFVAAVRHVPGMEVSVLCDSETARAREAFLEEGGLEPEAIVETDSVAEAADAVRAGKRVVTADPGLAPQLDAVDVITDVTPSPSSGADTAARAIDGGKDVVLINIEADVAVGPALRRRAERAGVLYSVSSGDEPGCLMELWDFVRSLGYTPVVIGKGKNNPLNVTATPDTVQEAAQKAGKDPYQIASYVDGTKTMFELTCVANATGCTPMRPGMIGPQATLDDVSQTFALKEDGGITEYPGVVDYVQGSSMSGGVFITVRVDDDRIQADLNYLKVGSGKYFTFFRPYHLWFLEAPISIARAVIDREPTLVPQSKPVADIAAVSKTDLEAGRRLDTFGGYTFRGRNHRTDDEAYRDALPVGLAPDAKVVRNVAAGDIIRYDDVELDEAQTIVQLRREQDAAKA